MKDEQEIKILVLTATTSGIVALLSGVARLIIQQKYGSWTIFLRGLLSSIVVGVMVGFAVEDYSAMTAGKLTLVAASAYLAEDLLVGFSIMGNLFRQDPLGFLYRIMDAIKGKKGESK